MGLTSISFMQLAPRATEFVEIVQNNGQNNSHDAIQDHRFQYQLKAHM